jgi:hypothetical protein
MNDTFHFGPTRIKIVVLTSLLVASSILGLFLKESIPLEAAFYLSPIVYIALSIRPPEARSPVAVSRGWRGRLLQVALGVFGLGMLLCFPANEGFKSSEHHLGEYVLSSLVSDFLGWAFIVPLALYTIVRQCSAWISPQTPRLRFGVFLFAMGCARIILIFLAYMLLSILHHVLSVKL